MRGEGDALLELLQPISLAVQQIPGPGLGIMEHASAGRKIIPTYN